MFINLTPATTSVAENNLPAMGATAPVEDRVRNLFASYSVTASQEKAAIINQASNGDPTNPAELLSLQNRVGNYSLAINMISTLTHKSASAIDSVLKAQ
ncbi:Methyl-accepting chemotaxis protein [Yersinia mollaretii ATCC 43969]|uniref:Methyl-accepting chemotaxis protein n=1 Tax=Yersinia mollaretii (strain ATCC 43969 / DSM 18520 / CIP 103324 / CNY 7263 / WAIP 204) TaxID=349967 RepID=A0ABM9YD65_YERMW|nr:type III secretion system inner rod subunit SctI [Yersinia mollaretii]EEQ11872.1 Methyl-accepting chemotaxis protein [Yersinia mollaretii ATCC 43969]QKJ02824.1 type III secretion system inner rod subunit SctI [Yersinia mollaretii ATCC 43969]